MNVYDFDGTILDGDSEIYFLEYIFNNYPKIDKYKSQSDKYINSATDKHNDPKVVLPLLYEFIKEFNNDELKIVLNDFWDKYECYIKDWYLKQKREDDVIASATPRFILEPIVERYHMGTLIASDFDTDNIKLTGIYNYANNKVLTYKQLFKDKEIDNFYSDSLSDLPMAKLAHKAYFVKGDEIIEWNTK